MVNDGVTDETDYDGWNEDQLADLVGCDGGEHRVHGERGEHYAVPVEEDGVVDVADEACDVEERSYGQGAEFFAGFDDLDLAELVALSDDIVVREHDCFGMAGCARGEV